MKSMNHALDAKSGHKNTAKSVGGGGTAVCHGVFKLLARRYSRPGGGVKDIIRSVLGHEPWYTADHPDADLLVLEGIGEDIG
ncbi:MAG: hypothetical protein HQL65_19870, partial [Magnetococcales bacterium]|nr:hypothetical protein [Magnetococcales bacterium]